MMPAWVQLATAAALNVGTIYCLKASKGMVRLWPTLGVIVTIFPTQWLMARAMNQGSPVASATIVVFVAVMIGSVVVGHFLGERPDGWQLTGYTLAIMGVAVATLPPTPAKF